MPWNLLWSSHGPDLHWLTAHSVEWNHLQILRSRKFHEIPVFLVHGARQAKCISFPSQVPSQQAASSDYNRTPTDQKVGSLGMIFLRFLGAFTIIYAYLPVPRMLRSHPIKSVLCSCWMWVWDGWVIECYRVSWCVGGWVWVWVCACVFWMCSMEICTDGDICQEHPTGCLTFFDLSTDAKVIDKALEVSKKMVDVLGILAVFSL